MPDHVPHEVLHAYFGNAPVTTHRIGKGLINHTLLAQTHNGKHVLQKLNRAFGPDLILDNAAVTDQLASLGWTVPRTRTTRDGQLYIRDQEGALWRRMDYMDHDDDVPEHLSEAALYNVGKLLGNLHTTLRTLDHEPQYTIPHFHDTHHYASRLAKAHSQLPSRESRMLAVHLLNHHTKLPALPNDQQLIHGDPQLTNMPFKNGMPLPRAFLDFDTVMVGTIWMDLGDLLRATLEDDLKAKRPVDINRLRPIIEGYCLAAWPGANANTFYNHALTATQLIALELGMRFVNDIMDENYFSWNETRFTSQHDNHMWRANMQWDIYRAVAEHKGTVKKGSPRVRYDLV